MRSCHIALALALTAPVASAQPPTGEPDAWPMDVLVTRSGRRFTGLLVKETPSEYVFHNVRRLPGRPTVIFASAFPRDEVEKVETITAEQRAELQARLADLDPFGHGERERMGLLELKPVAWEGKPDAALEVSSDFFTLRSTASEATVRRSAVRLEQIYTAYSRFLPPRFKGGSPTTILLLPSRAEYRKFAPAGLENPAFYEPAANRVVCASEIGRLSAKLEEVRRRHRERLAALDAQEAEFRKRFPPKELPRFLEPLRSARADIVRADLDNGRAFDKATARLFATLYHEAFHAYAANFVYPPTKGGLPRWLDEGLAQIFETAVVEAGELRIGHADPDRLARAKELLRNKELVPLAELLGAGPKEFLAGHGERREADRHYLTCWALASYLAFDRRVLGTAALDRYVQAVADGAEPSAAFAALAGRPAGECEKDFHRYLAALQSDGSASPVVPK
jgi:hypothetical protein